MTNKELEQIIKELIDRIEKLEYNTHNKPSFNEEYKKLINGKV